MTLLKKYKKSLILSVMFIFSIFFLFEGVYAEGTTKYISCGNQQGISYGLPGFIRSIITIIQIVVPILIILLGSIDFLKVVFGNNKDDLPDAFKRFLPRLIAGAAVFFVILLVKVFIGMLGGNNAGFLECVSCFTSNGNACHEYEVANEDHTSEKSQADKEREEREKQREEARKKNEEEAAKYKDDDDDGSTSSSATPGTKTIFVGDSRVVGMCGTLTGQWSACQFSNGGAYTHGNDIYVAQGSMGYDWFNSTAVPAINRILQSDPNTTYNIISNMGVNWLLSDVDKYIVKYKELANGVWKKHNIIIVSVNPVNETVESQHGYRVRQNDIKQFNSKIKSGISGLSNVKYCDTFNQIINNYQTSDGLHYTGVTYKNIYNHMVACIKN